MKKSRFSEAQIVGILKEVELGAKVNETCRKHGISEPTYYKWKSQFSGMTVSHLAQLRQLQDENAKLKRMYADFLIFDDVVNSIDDEHRGAIIDLILNPDEVGKRQLIVTTHGEDFVKRLENAVPMKKYKETVTRIDFLVPFAAKKITVKLDSPRHYLTVATRSYEEGRVRDSLSYVRKAFEEELSRLWKKIAKKKLSTQMNVSMRGPGDPDLMSLATGLHQFLSGKDVTVFQDAVPYLGEMLGYDEKHKVEWNYLNKGTHEEDRAEEFDAAVVRRMLETVIKLDEAIGAPQA